MPHTVSHASWTTFFQVNRVKHSTGPSAKTGTDQGWGVLTRLTNEYPCIHWILSWILNTSLVFGIHPQSEYWIPCCIQYSGDYWILWWEWYSVFSHKKKTKNYSYSVFSRENILSYKVIVSIHLCEKVSIQYSIQYSVMLTGRYSVFNTVFSLDDIWGSQYSTQYSVNTAIL